MLLPVLPEFNHHRWDVSVIYLDLDKGQTSLSLAMSTSSSGRETIAFPSKLRQSLQCVMSLAQGLPPGLAQNTLFRRHRGGENQIFKPHH